LKVITQFGKCYKALADTASVACSSGLNLPGFPQLCYSCSGVWKVRLYGYKNMLRSRAQYLEVTSYRYLRRYQYCIL